MKKYNEQELIQKVKTLNDEKKYLDTIKLLPDEVLDEHKNYQLYAEIAQAKYRLKDPDYIIYAQKSLNINENIKGYHYLALYYNKSDEFLKAEYYFKKILELDDKNYNALIQLGNIFANRKNFEQAKEYCKKALEIDPDNYIGYSNLGYVCLMLKDFDAAEENYNVAIKLKPNDSAVLNGYGAVFSLRKEFGKAESEYRKSIEISPNFSKPHHNLASALYAQEKYLEAKIFYEKSMELRESNDVYYNIGKARIEKINKILANEDYEKIQEIVSRIKKTLEYKDNCVAHFTSLSVAKLLVFESSKFRLSEGAYLNDTSEGIELFSFLNYQSPFGRKETPVDEIFVQKPFIGSFVSESKHNDLTMWRMYGKEGKDEAKGCAITMNVKNFIEQIQEELGINNLEENEIKFYQVAYWKDNRFIIPDEKITSAKIKNLNKYCIELRKSLHEFNLKDEEIKIQIDVEELLFEIAFLFKGIEYQYEHEVRLVQKGIGFEKIINKEFTIPRVYIELGNISKCIKKITLGPKVERADEWASAFHYELKNKEIEAEIHISRQPFK